MKYYGGCDVGSTYTKAVILDENGKICADTTIRSKINSEVSAKLAMEEVLNKVGLNSSEELGYLIGTGYGRNKVPFADENISEISCHAMGVHVTDPSVKAIIDIGGQDVKGISIDTDGTVKNFAMNDKCAAGTGRFYEAMARSFEMTLPEFSNLSLTAKNVIPITAQCTVFAESDLVHKIQVGYAREDIIAGLCNAVASNYLNNVGKGKKIAAPVVFQGGVSKNAGVVHAFEEQLGMPVAVDPDGHLMGAFGAALLAADAGQIVGAESGPFASGTCDFEAMLDFDFKTREIECQKCANHCEVICVYRDKDIIDSWGNRCDKGAVKTTA